MQTNRPSAHCWTLLSLSPRRNQELGSNEGIGTPEGQPHESSSIELNVYGDLQATRSTASNGPDWQIGMNRRCQVTGLVVAYHLSRALNSHGMTTSGTLRASPFFLVTSYHRCTADLDALRDWYPDARAAAQFIAELRTSQIDAQGPERWLAGRRGCFSQVGTSSPVRC